MKSGLLSAAVERGSLLTVDATTDRPKSIEFLLQGGFASHRILAVVA